MDADKVTPTITTITNKHTTTPQQSSAQEGTRYITHQTGCAE